MNNIKEKAYNNARKLRRGRMQEKGLTSENYEVDIEVYDKGVNSFCFYFLFRQPD